MARTAPVPNLPPIPGMCPSIAVMGGGGGAGGGAGSGAGGGSGSGGAGGAGSGDGANGDGCTAPDGERYPECGTASHPVDLATGRAFTHPSEDLRLPGPLPLVFERSYTSSAHRKDVGLGLGWFHSFSWQIEVGREHLTVRSDRGVGVRFPKLRPGEEHLGKWGWRLAAVHDGYRLRARDGVTRSFLAAGTETYLLSAIADRNHNTISFERSPGGHLVGATDSVGRRLRFHPDTEGRITVLEVWDPLANTWVRFAHYLYDEQYLGSAQDASGAIARYRYDVDGRLALDVDRAGLGFAFRYDDQGRCVEAWGDYENGSDPALAGDVPKFLADRRTPAKGIHHVVVEYLGDGAVHVIDSLAVRSYFANTHGLMDKIVAGGAVVTSTYDDLGFMLQQADPEGGVTTYRRDPRGNIIEKTNPCGERFSARYDDHELHVEILDPEGRVTAIERDARGNPWLVVDPLGQTTRHEYDAKGLRVRTTDASGAVERASYDAHGNLVELVLPSGGAYHWAYDGLGRVLSETDPAGSSRRWAYDARGLCVSSVDAEGAEYSFAYDGERRVVSQRNPDGGTVNFVWGGYQKLAAVVSPEGREVAYRYNREGDLVSVTDEAGGVHRFEVSGSGQIRSQVSPSGVVTKFVYDKCERVLTRRWGRETTHFAYDACGRLLEVNHADGFTAAYEYDASGHLVRATSPSGSNAFERDALGRVVRESIRIGEVQFELAWAYDARGRVRELGSSLGDRQTFERDLLGARTRTEVSFGRERWLDLRVEHTNDVLGREVERRFAHGPYQRQTYSARNELRERLLHHGGASGVGMKLEARYDAIGELRESTVDGSSRSYGYDRDGLLLHSATPTTQLEAYGRTALGEAHSAESERYGSSGRLLGSRGLELAYDLVGRLTSRRSDGVTWKFAYCGGRQLASASTSGRQVSYEYDAFGRRVRAVRRRGAEVEERLTVWDGDVPLHETDGAGEPVRFYMFEDRSFAPMLECRPGTRSLLFNDPSGCPIGSSSESSLVGPLERTSTGRLVGAPSDWTDLRLQGQRLDPDTGLAYNRFRDFDPTTGTFTTPDPLGLLAGTNHYAFPINSVSFVDPLGLDWNYRLVDSSGTPYYYGRASDGDTPAGVASRHRRTTGADGSRLGSADGLEQITPHGTGAATARGIEQHGVARGGAGGTTTAIGRRSCNGGNVRGNNIRGIDPNNPRGAGYRGAGTRFLNGAGVSNPADLPTLARHPPP